MNCFDPTTHIYTVNGVPVPSVTQVLAETGFIDKTWYTPAGAWRGTIVHEMLALWDCSSLDPASIDPKIAGYLEAWKKFCKEWNREEFSAIERPLYSPLGFAGTPDRVYVDSFFVVDIKTGEIPWWAPLQIAGYVELLISAGSLWSGLAVGVREDGTYTTKAYDALAISRARRVFRSALSCCQCIRAKGGL